jgi:hypothetical protein
MCYITHDGTHETRFFVFQHRIQVVLDYDAGIKRQSNPIAGLDRPLVLQEFEAPIFLDNQHMKVVRLSALGTGRLYLPGNTPGTHFCSRLSRPQDRGTHG